MIWKKCNKLIICLKNGIVVFITITKYKKTKEFLKYELASFPESIHKIELKNIDNFRCNKNG